MSNTITLSTDMNTLYLIDNGRAIPFDLTNGKGVLIGTLLGQITVTTANDEKSKERIAMASEAQMKPLPVKGNQWTVTYHEASRGIRLIGSLDIESSLAAPDQEKCKSIPYDLSKVIVALKRVENNIEVSSFPRSKSK